MAITWKMLMRKGLLLLVVCAFTVCGCARQYEMKLTNGSVISTPGKPKLKGSEYRYKDAKGAVHRIPQSRVRQIQPASMAEEDQRIKTPAYPKPKTHWWQFWR
jgi:hypothetical protein